MSKLRDFQVYVSSARPQKAINEALFATAEPLRLWLRARKFEAPFQKLLVTLRDAASSNHLHGHTTLALGICEIAEAVDMTELPRDAHDHRWVLGVVRHALSRVFETTGWRSSALDAHVDELAAGSPPLICMFEKLSVRDRATGAVCVPWFRSCPGLFEFGARITGAGSPRDVTAVHSTSPIYLEDTFPLAAIRLRGSELTFMDKEKNSLAVVDIAEVAS